MRPPGMNSALYCSLKLRLTYTFTRFLSKFIPPRSLPFGVFAALIIEIKKIIWYNYDSCNSPFTV